MQVREKGHCVPMFYVVALETPNLVETFYNSKTKCSPKRQDFSPPSHEGVFDRFNKAK